MSPTRNELQFFADVHAIRRALERIADALERQDDEPTPVTPPE